MIPFGRVEVFASGNPRDVRERGLVLRAQGIPYDQLQRGGLFFLVVEEPHAEQALRELSLYETENKSWRVEEEPPPSLPGGKLSTLVFAVLLAACHAFAQAELFGLSWLERGAAHAERLLSTEPWRAVTALFLHAGPVHLASNLVFGSLFGFLVASSVGGGLGWAAILLGGALGNVTNALLLPPEHVSVGASTAVFAAVGVLGGSEWRRRNLMRQRQLRRAAPIVMALVLLAFHGIPQVPGRVDVGAHVCGLAWGLVLGAFLPWLLESGARDLRRQVRIGLGALLLIFFSWSLALGLPSTATS